MNKKIVLKVFIIAFVIILFAGLCVLTFVDFDSFKKTYYTLQYETTDGGRIEGSICQTIQEGKDGQTITAIPDEGYRFLRWADTCSPSPTRTDTNVAKDVKAQAKFVKISDVKYKILLVHVTEVQATFKDKDGNDIVADYKMTEEDLEVCRMTTELFDICLNELFDGLVTFEIDEYYTKEIMREENFEYEVYEDAVDTNLYAQGIPEIADKLNSYRSFLTNVPLNDPEELLTIGGGVTNNNTASIRYKVLMPKYTLPSGEIVDSYDLINDYSDYQWVGVIETYVHEFVHTVEEQITATWRYRYHYILGEYRKAYKGQDPNLYMYEISKLYLLNQAEYNGETVGIPFPVWTNEIYEVHYNSNDESMGTIGSFSSPLKVAKGFDGEEMEAIPWPGYRFAGWSDGSTAAKRIDKNIQSDMEVIAYFKPDKYTVNYIATEGGFIEGQVSQTMYGKCDFEPVTAVAEEGYRFVGWSDGLDSAKRSDWIDAITVNIFNQNDNNLVLTAIFEKVN